MKKIIVLVSGHGSNLQAIIDACQRGEIRATVVAVISNKMDAYGLTRANQANINTHLIGQKKPVNRDHAELELRQVIDSYGPDLIVLAGYMSVLSTRFVHAYSGKILNIHPSLLPKYPGLDTYRRVLAARDKVHGATVHFVTADIDQGPRVLQAVIPILSTDSEIDLMNKTHQMEHTIYPLAIAWYVSGRLVMVGSEVFFDKEKLPATGLQITYESTTTDQHLFQR